MRSRERQTLRKTLWHRIKRRLTRIITLKKFGNVFTMYNLQKLLIKALSNSKLQKASNLTSGFTMTELLVATAVASIIIVPILTFAVDMLNRDVGEQAKANSEQELQTAISYIAQDMSQAFYVYEPDYVGEPGKTPPIPSYDDFIKQLPHSEDEDKNPILVFWKRKLIEDSRSPDAEDTSIECPTNESQCDDSFVQSLVAYYLIEEKDKNSIWCQPSGSSCPKRIARFEIQDGVKDYWGNYFCGTNGRSEECSGSKKKFKRDLGYTSYDNSNPTGWTKKTDEDYSNSPVVLVNYIEDFTLDSASDYTKDSEIKQTELAKGKTLARVTILGNAMRRRRDGFSCIEDNSTTPPTYKKSPYCPKATAQVGPRSGFGE